mmetsp:Transcript_109166/g.307826  ORF Transcript_109166/g.307826 Transcript_109166/m.307826 type:complete len:451 (-) Transcript_109166:899-2251(-)
MATFASLSPRAPSASNAKAQEEPGSNSTTCVARPVARSGAGDFKSAQPRARVTATPLSASGGVQSGGAPRATHASALSRIRSARATSLGQCSCNLLKGPWKRVRIASFKLAALAPSGTSSKRAAAAGSASGQPASCAAKSSATKTAAGASVCNIVSTTFVAASSLAKAATACGCMASLALSGCTTNDRFRKMRRTAAEPSRRSAIVNPSAANGFVACETRSSSRPWSSAIASKEAWLALRGCNNAAVAPRAQSWLSNRSPMDATRKRSSLFAAVCTSPPTSTSAVHAPAPARALGASGLQSKQRVAPRVPTTRRPPVINATARPQPAKRAGESNSMPSSPSAASLRMSASSKSSHSVARAPRRGSSSAWNFLAQNSVAAPALRRPSQSTKSDAGRSRKSSGCFKMSPVLWSSGSSTAMSSLLPAEEGRLALEARTDNARCTGSCGTPTSM